MHAAAQLFWSPAQPRPPYWLADALEAIADLVAAQMRERQNAPSRAGLRDLIGRLREAIDALKSQCVDSQSLNTLVLSRLSLDPVTPVVAELLTLLSGRGQDDLFDRLSLPDPKLLVACAVIALYALCYDVLPDPKAKRVIALSSAMLWWARERTGDPASAADTRPTQWMGPLTKMQRIYASDRGAIAAILARWARDHRVDIAPIVARFTIDGTIERCQKAPLYAQALLACEPDAAKNSPD